MRDLASHGLPIAALIAAGAMCLFLAFAPAAHTPSGDRVTGHVQKIGRASCMERV